ncbi:MAG TPA: VOC family protein [Steroidobacteraceae bacterium]|nr:VOC family protein [Steroidobacteraceae bacterium]
MSEPKPQAPASLDHVGFVGRDLMPLMVAFDRLGFRLTEPRLLMRQNAQTGERESLEQSSCHAVFAAGYIEFSAVHTRARTHHLAAYLESGPALKIVALGTDDVLERHAAAARAGLAPTAPALAARDISYGRRHGEARFRWFMLAPEQAPEGLVCVVRNLTPELVFQPEVQKHPNGATALSGMTVRVDDLDAASARYASVLGVEPDPADGIDGMRTFSLGGQWLRLATPAVLAECYPGVVLPAAPSCIGITVAVRSIAGVVGLLGANGIEFRRSGGDCVWTTVPAAGGTIVEFRGTPQPVT